MTENPYSVGSELDPPNNEPQNETFDGSVRGMQIVAGALMFGALNFLLVVVLISGADVFGLGQPTLIAVIAAVIGAMMIGAHLIVPGIIASSQLRSAASQGMLGQDEATRNNKVMEIYRTQLIIGLALLEGAAFLNLVALMVGKSVASLAVFAILMCLMFLKFPTQSKVSWWVQDKLREIL